MSLSSCHELPTERLGREGSSYIKLRAYPCLNSSKCPFHISLARAKLFEILIVSTASRNRFMKMLRFSDDWVVLGSSGEGGGSIRSEVADARGYVKHNLNILWTTCKAV